MVRIEKAYTGYCVHQEEATQALQELEKNETVKTWLEVPHLTFPADRRHAKLGMRSERKRGTSTPCS